MFILFAGIFILSCSDGNPPLMPDADEIAGAVESARRTSDQKYLWGMWEYHIDLDEMSVDITPLREAELTCNVNRFIDGPPLCLTTEIEQVDEHPDFVDITLNVGIRHPFPGLGVYTGFDVIGVFMGDGTSTWIGPDGFAIAGEEDQQLLNPDGYTRWFNASEFSDAGDMMPLQGYSPGQIGTADYLPTAVLCPYRYFADGLDADEDTFEFLGQDHDNRGSFNPGAINHRKYELRFPKTDGIKFQYAIIAHWKKNTDYPTPPENLDDFPPEANSDESLVMDIVDNSTVYYGDASTYGGDVIINISPWDWTAEVTAGVVEEYGIFCRSTAWSGAYAVDMVPVETAQYHHTFLAEIPVEIVESIDPIPVWIEVRYPELDYSNPFGVANDADGNLTSYFLTYVSVSDEVPFDPTITVLAPDGGENWLAGEDYEISWTSQDITGTVFIEYSKDDFVSDINLVTYDEENDGSFIYVGVPNDPSDTVKVRVSWMADSSVRDTSDDYFSIIEPQELTLTSPNGQEVWYVDSSGEITWEWEGDITSVKLELSCNSGVDYDTVIIESTECDGLFQWEPIPLIESTSSRIKISNTEAPVVNDESDGDFMIEQSLEGWVPKSTNVLIKQPHQYEVPVDIAVFSDGDNESRGEIIRQFTGNTFYKFNDDYSNTTGFWQYVIPDWLVGQGVWIHTIRKFDANISGNWLFVTNNDDHPGNPIQVVDPMHGVFSGNNNTTGEFSHNAWSNQQDMFFFGDTGFFIGVPDPEILPWLYISDFSSGVPGGIVGDSSILFLAPMSPLEDEPSHTIGFGYWNPPFNEHSFTIWKIESGEGIVDDTNPRIMALAVDDDTGLAIYDFEDITTFWVLDTGGNVQAIVLALIPSEAIAVLPGDKLDSSEYGNSIPVDIEIVPAKKFDYEITHFNWLAALLDNGDGTWSVGVWEYEYITDGGGGDNGSKFWEIDITDPIAGVPQSLDVDCNDFEIHVLYENEDELYAVTVFEYYP